MPDDSIFSYGIHHQTSEQPIMKEGQSSYHGNNDTEDGVPSYDDQTNDIQMEEQSTNPDPDLKRIMKLTEDMIDDAAKSGTNPGSFAWLPFTKLENGKKVTAKCIVCEIKPIKIIKGSTRPLWHHLKTYHINIYKYLKSPHGPNNQTIDVQMQGQSLHQATDKLIFDKIMEIAEDKIADAAKSGTKPGSFAWVPFTRHEDGKKVKAKCIICGDETKERTDSSTAPLWNHLYKHYDVHAYLKRLTEEHNW
uniref:BED-type domain-containing protein n=1 Tax=Meloidogyne hapla TaxID=6305 RepID=A0A1I8BER9_MELHA